MAPENNINNLQSKDISIILSKSDKVIPYKLGEELVNKMKEVGLKPLVKVNRYLGHYGTVIYFYLKFKP